MSGSPTAPARPAATAIVLRPAPADRGPFEVLLVRRNDRMAFMGGAYVFPGGRVDDSDAPPPADACDGLDAASRCRDLAPAEEARYRVAAIRELLEEAGVLLARRHGTMVDLATAAAVRASLPGPSSFTAHVVAHGLRLALDAVVPFAHWVTPEVETRRFDTRFLMARMPAGQEASHDEGETTALEWLPPAAAVARAVQGGILLPPPTWSTLSRLTRFGSVDEALHWASTTPIVRIEPRFSREGGVTTLMLPGGPAYPLAPGLEPLEHTRFVLAEGVWRPVPPS